MSDVNVVFKNDGSEKTFYDVKLEIGNEIVTIIHRPSLSSRIKKTVIPIHNIYRLEEIP